MQVSDTFQPALNGLVETDWLHQFKTLGETHGFYEPLGRLHAASFVDAGDTLMVSFESLSDIRQIGKGVPLSFRMRRRAGWSALSVISKGRTWFRARQIAAAFEQMRADGFFDAFEQVLFYGEGDAGYAAAAYAAACPGAHVLALAPQATLDPRLTGWDDRYRAARRLSFDGPFGYAPDGIPEAGSATILFDPYVGEDAAHAALFAAYGADLIRMPHFGSHLARDLRRMGLMPSLLRQAAKGRLTATSFAPMLRTRRTYPPYLRAIVAHLVEDGQPDRARWAAQAILKRQRVPAIARWLEETNSTH